jgi:hypothetical protein
MICFCPKRIYFTSERKRFSWWVHHVYKQVNRCDDEDYWIVRPMGGEEVLD